MGDLNHIRAAVTRRKLNDAEPVAMRIEPHGLSIDRRRAAIARQIGQVGAVQPYRHVALIVDNSCEFVCGRCRNCGSRAVLLRWCPGEDSNLHGFHHWYLKPARLPIPPPGLAGTHKYPGFALSTRLTRSAARRWLPICDAKLASGCPVQARNDPVFGATPIFKARRPRTRRGTAVHHVDMLVTVFGG